MTRIKVEYGEVEFDRGAFKAVYLYHPTAGRAKVETPSGWTVPSDDKRARAMAMLGAEGWRVVGTLAGERNTTLLLIARDAEQE